MEIQDTTYANCEIFESSESTYANVDFDNSTNEVTSTINSNQPSRNTSRLHNCETSLAEQLKEQLALRGITTLMPAVLPKPENVSKDVKSRQNEPRPSFLHKKQTSAELATEQSKFL